MINQLKTLSLLLGAFLLFYADQALAQKASCIFSEDGKATARVDFSYTSDDGSGQQRGSGFIVTPDGYLITDAHVITPMSKDIKIQAQNISVKVGGSASEDIVPKVVQIDAENDLALLQLPPRKDGEAWPVVRIANNSDLEVGATLIGLGFASAELAIIPAGLKTARNSLVNGVVKPWWQTNLGLNAGDSGGPVFGSLGTVVGIAVAKNEQAQLVTWIIPISRAQHLLDYANVKNQKYAQCAIFPECRIESNGPERYAVDETKEYKSDEHKGGYNQGAFCNEELGSIKQLFPNSILTVLSHRETSRNASNIPGVNDPRYTYFCTIQRQEEPVYKLKASADCLP